MRRRREPQLDAERNVESFLAFTFARLFLNACRLVRLNEIELSKRVDFCRMPTKKALPRGDLDPALALRAPSA